MSLNQMIVRQTVAVACLSRFDRRAHDGAISGLHKPVTAHTVTVQAL